VKKFDVIIIGSGISGLTSAILLAKKNFKVAVVEKHSKAGGYMHAFSRFGAAFDTGGHYVGAMSPGKPFWALLNHLGVFHDDLFVPLAADGYDHFHFPGGIFKFQKGYAATVAGLCEGFPQEKDAIVKYFELVQSVSQEFPTTYYDTTFNAESVARWLSVSLDQVLADITSNELLRSVLSAYCCLHGVKPKDIAFGPHAIITDTLISGAYTFRKNGDELVKSFLQRCNDLGVEIFLNEEVVRLETKDQSVQEVVTSKQRLTSQWVISSQHPKQTFALLSEDNSTLAYKTRLNSLPESDGIFAVYAALKEKSNFKPYANYYYFGSDVMSEIQDTRPLDVKIAYLCRPGKSLEREQTEPPHLSVHFPCLYKEFSEWKETSFGKRPPEYKAYKEKYVDSAFSFLKNQGLDLRPAIKNYVTSSPLSNLHFNGSFEGTSYGIYHGIKSTGIYGLQPRTKIKNLLLTGQNISFPGLQSSASAAVRTCGSIVGIKPLLQELKAWIHQGEPTA